MFYLIRHGETNYSERNTKIYQGFGVNLSPLSEVGVKQIKETATDSRLIVACHGMMIQAVTEKNHPYNGEIIEFEL